MSGLGGGGAFVDSQPMQGGEVSGAEVQLVQVNYRFLQIYVVSKGGPVCARAQWPIRGKFILCFGSSKRLGVFLNPIYEMLQFIAGFPSCPALNSLVNLCSDAVSIKGQKRVIDLAVMRDIELSSYKFRFLKCLYFKINLKISIFQMKCRYC